MRPIWHLFADANNLSLFVSANYRSIFINTNGAVPLTSGGGSAMDATRLPRPASRDPRRRRRTDAAVLGRFNGNCELKCPISPR
jgi:hypothetical protein